MATIRHDFSFPPKSNSLNNNNNNNRQQQNVGLSSSATAPIFSSYKFNDSSHMMIRTPTVSAPKPFNKYKTAHYTTHSVYTHQKHSNDYRGNHHIPTKDPNCSFTFDELKHTLSFMDDSPLLKSMPSTSSLTVKVPSNATTSLSSSSSNSSQLSSSSAASSTNPINEDQGVLRMVTNQSQYTNGGCGSIEKRPANLVESLLIKKSSTINEQPQHQKGYISSSASLNSISNQQFSSFGSDNDIECAAKKYRCSAQNSEATCSWKGVLPPKTYKSPVVYSTKVFVGGLPWDIIEDDIIKEFGIFGPCRVEWTNKPKSGGNNRNNKNPNFYPYSNTNQNAIDTNLFKQRSSPGFVYVIYENEFSVRGLVNNCIEDYANGRDRVEYYFKISTRRVRNKEVQIIPWILADNNYALCTPKDLDSKKTVFVGNLHGQMGARDLAHIMNELFGGVVYAGIDIDKLKYPIGSGRVTFTNQQNFMQAIRASYVDIETSKFSKRIQIDPYLEDVECCSCNEEKGIYFCRDFQCFSYFCGPCWSSKHSFDTFCEHKPLMRRREDNRF